MSAWLAPGLWVTGNILGCPVSRENIVNVARAERKSTEKSHLHSDSSIIVARGWKRST